ncbi:MAG: TerC/Alx family metal homeostasis membrane protein [Chitinophagaceae bacterium]
MTKNAGYLYYLNMLSTEQISFLVFSFLLLSAILFDLGLLSKKNATISIRQALYQTFFWVALALSFFIFLWIEEGQSIALEYLSAYLMEWGLSIDNIFVFILIFSAFAVKPQYFGRVLFIGILMAIFFRILFITAGVALVYRFEWLLYIFGLFLVYSGYKMFVSNQDEEYDPLQSGVYLFLKRFLPLVPHDGGGKYLVREKGKPAYTTLFVVVIMLAMVDLVFALDSIPAVLGISRSRLVIYTSNIFAVLGLRSVFGLLRGAVNEFDYLQQGVAIVLVFVGVKMLGEHWLQQWLDKNTLTFISLGVIVCCLFASILYSIVMQKKGNPPDIRSDE